MSAQVGFLSPIGLILQAFSDQGIVGSGYLINTYVAGSTTKVPTYTDSTLTTPNANPIVMRSNGRLPASVWAPSGTLIKMVITDAQGNSIPGATVDNLPGINDITTSLFPQTPAEQSAGVVPTNYNYEAYDVRRYGAAPAASAAANNTAFNNAFLAASFEPDAMVFGGPGNYSNNGTFTIDTNKVGFDGRGCFLNCTTMTSGNLWNIVQSDSNSFLRVSRNKSHTLRNFVAQGPGAAVACKFVDLTDTSGLSVIAGITFEHGGSIDWQTHFNFGVGAYFEMVRDWDFTSILGSSVFVNMPGVSQSGENNIFDNCRFVPGQSAGGILINNANSDTTFSHCDFDAVGFTNNTFLALTGGTVRLTDCHMESSVDAAYWVSVSGFSSSLFITNLQLVCDTVKTAFAPFFCNSDAAGISIGAVLFDSQPGVTVPLVAGTGPVRFNGPLNSFSTGGATTPAYIASCLNVLSDPGFESGVFTPDGWVASGGTPPTITGTDPHSGTLAAKFAGVSTQTNALTGKFACAPGKLVTGQCWITATTWTAGTTMSGTLFFQNAAGTALQTFNFAAVTAGQNYTRVSINSAVAPPGTTQIEIQFFISGTTSGAPVAYLDDLMLNIA